MTNMMTTMMNKSAAELGEELISVINSENVAKTIECLQQFSGNMRNPVIGADHVVWISEPVNLTRVHSAIVEHLNIPQRAMAIKRLLMSRPQRAMLLMQAMEIAIKRSHNLKDL